MSLTSPLADTAAQDPTEKSRLSPIRTQLFLDPACSITDISGSARKLLGYVPGAVVDPCFFAHIHSRNLLQVMRDLASMACNGKETARWLVRMRNASRQWVWMRLSARRVTETDSTAPGVVVDLARLDA